MTDCTAQIAVQSGLLEDDVFVIPPGRTNSSMSTFNNSHSEFLKWLSNSRFFLFMGPPTTIRGLFHLLLAFDLLAKKNNEVRLVCLFRSDGMTNQSKVTRYINNLQCRNRIFTVWRNLSPSDITFFLTKCHAVVMPFLLVPSELPLTIIESIGFAKPVIISESGGTSNFVREFGLVVPPASIKHLTNAMEILLKDDNLYKKLCAVGHSAYIRHPTWTDVAAMWLNVAYATLNISHQKCK
ncbi:MAG: glycosyltransferase [Candidatus Bilamarchaeaceae archaeon]